MFLGGQYSDKLFYFGNNTNVVFILITTYTSNIIVMCYKNAVTFRSFESHKVYDTVLRENIHDL